MTAPTGPIFLGGLAHSGKTQVRIVLGAHPDLSMTRRTALWDRFYGRFGDLRDERNVDRCLAAIVADRGAAQLAADPDRIRRELAQGRPSYARLFGLLHRHHAERHGKRRWGDQLGGVERFADPIFDGFPTARMIHMIRDPRAEAPDGLRPRFGAVGWNTARWVTSAEWAVRNARRFGGRYRIVRYEHLADAPEQTLREICGWLGEEFLPGMADAAATIRFDDTRTTGDTRSAVGSPPARAFIDRYAARDLRRFDYPGDPSGGLSVPQRVTFALLDRPVNRASMAAKRWVDSRPSLGRVS